MFVTGVLVSQDPLLVGAVGALGAAMILLNLWRLGFRNSLALTFLDLALLMGLAVANMTLADKIASAV